MQAANELAGKRPHLAGPDPMDRLHPRKTMRLMDLASAPEAPPEGRHGPRSHKHTALQMLGLRCVIKLVECALATT